MSARWSASITDATGRMRACKVSPRLEVRVLPCDGRWEVHSCDDGMIHRFFAADAALRCACEIARRAWVDHGRLSCVKCFVHDTWDVTAVYGVSPPPARLPRVPSLLG